MGFTGHGIGYHLEQKILQFLLWTMVALKSVITVMLQNGNI